MPPAVLLKLAPVTVAALLPLLPLPPGVLELAPVPIAALLLLLLLPAPRIPFAALPLPLVVVVVVVVVVVLLLLILLLLFLLPLPLATALVITLLLFRDEAALLVVPGGRITKPAASMPWPLGQSISAQIRGSYFSSRLAHWP